MYRAHLILPLVVALAACAGSAQDRIIRADGVVLPSQGGRPITVTKETVRAIEYQLLGIPATLKIEPKQVSEIRYARVPDAYSTALRSMKNGMYAQAIADFEAALQRGGGFHWLKQNALYRVAACRAELGEYGKAVQAFRDLLREVPDTRFFGDAWNGIIQAYLLQAGAFRGLGECLFKTAGENDHKTLKTARNYFLRAIMLGDQHPGQVEREDVARSLYYAGRCFVILGRQDRHDRRRAREMFRELMERFPAWQGPR